MRMVAVRPNVHRSAIPAEQELLSRSWGCFERSLSCADLAAIAAEAWPVAALVVVGLVLTMLVLAL